MNPQFQEILSKLTRTTFTAKKMEPTRAFNKNDLQGYQSGGESLMKFKRKNTPACIGGVSRIRYYLISALVLEKIMF